MVFKDDWEKIDDVNNISADLIAGMIAKAFPNDELQFNELISGGCANLNVKFKLKGNERLHILRIYIRDKDAAFKEQKLSSKLKTNIPIPKVIYVSDYGGFKFAITEFISGVTLRELLLSNETYLLGDIMFEVGLVLSKITAHEFTCSGFFDKDLNIINKSAYENYLSFAKECLKNQMVLTHLDADDVLKINLLLDHNINFLPSANEKSLVHGDFDPANILVDKINGEWKITGVMDWEFAYSGSVLCDVANMLRYEHQMPLEFKDEFIRGLKSGGINLPENWRITCDLLNLISLLDCLARSDPKNSTNRCTDICELIKDITDRLENN